MSIYAVRVVPVDGEFLDIFLEADSKEAALQKTKNLLESCDISSEQVKQIVVFDVSAGEIVVFDVSAGEIVPENFTANLH